MKGRTLVALALILSVALASCGSSRLGLFGRSDLIIKHTDHYLDAEWDAVGPTYQASTSWVIKGNGEITRTYQHVKNRHWAQKHSSEITSTSEYRDWSETASGRIPQGQLQAIIQAIDAAGCFQIPYSADCEVSCVWLRGTHHEICVTQQSRTDCVKYFEPQPAKDCPTRTRQGEALLQIEDRIHEAIGSVQWGRATRKFQK
jgi:hypothetical protein